MKRIKYGHLGQGDCPSGQVPFHYHLPSGKEIRKIICQPKEQTKSCLGQAIFETEILAPSWSLFSLWECYMSYLVLLGDFQS